MSPRAPLDARQARRIEHAARRKTVSDVLLQMSPVDRLLLRRVTDQVGCLGDWPVGCVEDLLSTHLTFTKRFTLTVFLLGNRCPPVLIAEWMLRRRQLHNFDARKHVIGILQAHKSSTLEDKTFWEIEGTTPSGDPRPPQAVNLITPSFSSEPRWAFFWQDAIKMLEKNAH